MAEPRASVLPSLWSGSVARAPSADPLQIGRRPIGNALAHGREELVRTKRLAQAASGAELGRERQIIGRRRLAVAKHEARHRNYRNVRADLVEGLNALDAVHAGH